MIPEGFERKNGMERITIRTTPNDKSPVTEVAANLKRKYGPERILDEGTTGLFKYPTRWLVVDNDPESPFVQAMFVSIADERFVEIVFQLSRDRWKHCMSTAIKISQTLDR